MFVSGFTIAKNVVRLDYPIKEAILSILPLCDEIVVCVGYSEDGTLELIQSINSEKIKIIHSRWDESLRSGGQVLAIETNKAFDAINEKSDWAIYIQADECLHEKSLGDVKTAMKQYLNNPEVEGLLFNYTHFYGSYDFIGDAPNWYRKEVRVIRNNKKIRSYKDAQGFRIDGRKLRVKECGADMFHYGWVKDPRVQQMKQKEFNRLWHDDQWITENIGEGAAFDYGSVSSLARFKGAHPAVMQNRINNINWTFDHDPSVKNIKFKYRVKMLIEKLTGRRIGEYKNYRVV